MPAFPGSNHPGQPGAVGLLEAEVRTAKMSFRQDPGRLWERAASGQIQPKQRAANATVVLWDE
jgi:hypothetical protein